VPSTLLQTNVCSPARNQRRSRNDIWDNFSSASYKALPPVGSVTVRHPITGAASDYPLPGGGRGFTRPASLVSVWSTAPFLQNNALGRFDPSPSVEARMRVFNEAIEWMLWPERRPKDRIFANDNGPGVGIIDRTTAESVLFVPRGFIPPELRGLLGVGQRTLSHVLPQRRCRDWSDPARLSAQSDRQHRRARAKRADTEGTCGSHQGDAATSCHSSRTTWRAAATRSRMLKRSTRSSPSASARTSW
jgi:hypothetical protein